MASESDVELPSDVSLSSVQSDSDVELPVDVESDGAGAELLADPDSSVPVAHDSDSELDDIISLPASIGSSEHMGEGIHHDVPWPGPAVTTLDLHHPQCIAEFYSPPRVLTEANRRGLHGIFSLDIVTGWDFSKADVQALSIRLLNVYAIMMLILSPPCTAFSKLMHMWNYKKYSTEKANRIWEQGLTFLRHAMHAAEMQMAGGRLFAFEHPLGASSWAQPCVQRIMAMPSVSVVTFDQCMVGLVSKIGGVPMRKRTRIMTNCDAIVMAFSGKLCDKSHLPHEIIRGDEGGMSRARWAQVYPPGLVAAIVSATCTALGHD